MPKHIFFVPTMLLNDVKNINIGINQWNNGFILRHLFETQNYDIMNNVVSFCKFTYVLSCACCRCVIRSVYYRQSVFITRYY